MKGLKDLTKLFKILLCVEAGAKDDRPQKLIIKNNQPLPIIEVRFAQ
jgi:hypothetical protein